MMCRKKNRPKNTYNNGNGKESRKPSDQDRKKPAGFGKGYAKETPRGKEKPPPKDFRQKLAKSSADFFRRTHKHRETFLENPDFI